MALFGNIGFNKFNSCEHSSSKGCFSHLARQKGNKKPTGKLDCFRQGKDLPIFRVISKPLLSRFSIAMAVGFARGLMGWSRYQRVPTWLNLRAMWGWPTKGGDHAYLAKAKPKFEQDARDVGLPASWLDGTPPPLSTSASEVLARLRA